MALSASTISYSTPEFQSKQCKHPTSQLQRCLTWCVHYEIYPKRSRKVMMAQMGEPNKMSVPLRVVKDRLWEAVPDAVKDFPWKKAEVIVLERLFFLGQNALKWSLIIFFIFIFLPDAAFSISRNQELMIPLGLSVGCLMSDFLRNTLQEVFSRSKGIGLHRHLLSISCFFVFVKIMSAFVPVQARVFPLHVANGGLMQVLWLWRSLVEINDNGSPVHSI